MKKPRFALAKASAEELLAAAGVLAAPVDVQALAERAGARVRYRSYEGAGGMAGALVRKPDGSVIGVNLDDPLPRQRFTIAHEVGHLILHDDNVHVDKRIVLFRDQDSATAKDAAEIEANQFASHLLMPAFLLQADIDVAEFVDLDDTAERLAQKYVVSVPAMTLRLAKFVRYGL
jgi:Zn-dependent peptidase ImmA (M78 family)